MIERSLLQGRFVFVEEYMHLNHVLKWRYTCDMLVFKLNKKFTDNLIIVKRICLKKQMTSLDYGNRMKC